LRFPFGDMGTTSSKRKSTSGRDRNSQRSQSDAAPLSQTEAAPSRASTGHTGPDAISAAVSADSDSAGAHLAANANSVTSGDSSAQTSDSVGDEAVDIGRASNASESSASSSRQSAGYIASALETPTRKSLSESFRDIAGSASSSAAPSSSPPSSYMHKKKKQDPIRAFFDPEQSLIRQENPKERESLRHFFQATRGVQWDSKSNWNSERPLNYWHRVKCVNGKVLSLELNNNNLAGPMPVMVSLVHLVNLSVSGNALYGPVDWETLCNSVPKLQRFDISHNQFCGFIEWKVIVDVWTELSTFNISQNQFEGVLPSDPQCIRKLSATRYIDVSGNNLEGSL
jgi:hypothetical protein